ncbi:MAG: serine hydrolase [Rubrivivax sp.]
MIRRRTVIAAAGLAGGCSPMRPAPPGPAALDHELQALLQDPRAPLLALAALALRDGEVVYQGAFGWRHAGDGAAMPPLPVTPRTLFRVASISKLVVTLGVMRLVEQGRLTLDDDVSRWLGWRLRHPRFDATPITLRLLLSHRSGLSDGGERYNLPASTRLQDLLQPQGAQFSEGLNWNLARAPGTWFEYVNLNFGVIAQVMECATGDRFDRLMQRLVLQPLGLRGGFDPSALPSTDLADIATLYRRRRIEGGREVWDPQGPWVVQTDDFRRTPPASIDGLDRYVVGTNGTLFGPQGRLRTGVAELGVVMRMLLHQGRHEAQAFLQPQTVALMASEQWHLNAARDNGAPDRDGALSWGLGVQRFTDQGGPGRGDRLVEGGGFAGWGHGADAYGLTGVMAVDPQRHRGIVVLLAGPGIDPATHRARDSALDRWAERALGALFKHS